MEEWEKWKDKCVICHLKIDKNKEKYVNLRDYTGKKFVSECFYHINCWQNRFTITQEVINKQANDWLEKISNFNGGKKVMQIQ